MSPIPPATLCLGNSSRMMENARGKTGPGDPLDHPGEDQQPQRGSEPAQDGADREDGKRDDEQLLLAEHVSHAPEHRGGNGRAQEEGAQQPGHVRLAGVQVVLDGVEGRQHHGLHERVGQRADCEDGERHPVVLARRSVPAALLPWRARAQARPQCRRSPEPSRRTYHPKRSRIPVSAPLSPPIQDSRWHDRNLDTPVSVAGERKPTSRFRRRPVGDTPKATAIRVARVPSL